MARYKSCKGTIKAGSNPSVVGEVTSWSDEASANIKSFFILGNCNEQSDVGGISRSVSIEGNYDPDDVGQLEVLVGESVDLQIYPLGEETGAIFFEYKGVVESISRSASADDFITFSASIKVNDYREQITG